MSGTAFTPQEIEQLRAFLRTPRRYGDVKAMARALSRSPKSIARKLDRLKAVSP